MTKEEIYEYMVTQYAAPGPEIPCEFDVGRPCARLYEKVYDARIRLSERTGIDFEDPDIMDIVENLEEIAKICSLIMFDYGTKYGKSDPSSKL